VRHTSVLSVLAALLIGGCGGASSHLRSENASLSSKVAELRAQARRDRRVIRDLENQVFLLKDRLETARLEADRAGPPVELPVEVLEPDEESGQAETDAAPAGTEAGESYQVVGVDDDGNPIIYAGDAASDKSVRPSIELYEDGGDVAPRKREAAASYETPKAPPERIPAMGGALPTVGEQLRERKRETRTRAVDDAGAREAYKRYYDALRAGNHAHAITGFRSFLEQYPNHDYADNAQYWLGEAFYDQRQFKSAVREFRAVVDNYPRGNKVPDALLKVGYCYLALGKLDKGRGVLEQVVAIYPKSGPAKLAARKLEELQKENQE